MNTIITNSGIKIKDSGTRREFDTGSVRDAAGGKGRMDLLPVFALEKLQSFAFSGKLIGFLESIRKTGWLEEPSEELILSSWMCHYRAIRGYDRDYLIAAACLTLWALDEEESGCKPSIKILASEMPWIGMIRLSKLYEAGCLKYGDRNWEKGQPVWVYLDSGARHLAKHMAGWTDEDHLNAAAWNQMSALETLIRIYEKRTLPTFLLEGLASLPEEIQ